MGVSMVLPGAFYQSWVLRCAFCVNIKLT